MPAKALVQARIDSNVKAQATAVLGKMGMTVSEAVRVLLTRTANEGALPFPLLAGAQEHDAWFRARVQEAIDDPRPPVSSRAVKAKFSERRVFALQKTASGR